MTKISLLVFTAVLVFGCITLQLFMGTLNRRCIKINSNPEIQHGLAGEETICQLS
jgi:hypothetical protein